MGNGQSALIFSPSSGRRMETPPPSPFCAARRTWREGTFHPYRIAREGERYVVCNWICGYLFTGRKRGDEVPNVSIKTFLAGQP